MRRSRGNGSLRLPSGHEGPALAESIRGRGVISIKMDDVVRLEARNDVFMVAVAGAGEEREGRMPKGT
ncbi:hypothetical protein GWI33_012666 [Rhynchophorus ferrugineus]|uniref:Uncharacterized protein n=1 Tax=Rhynchophorus ferrugineus TaxID=354439 RepID=A0A834IAY6_RHYFE|nr:hypothetical protein GWI33_012666 [Rhynchophorus ferrugineus]